jgi:hypothetical protein
MNARARTGRRTRYQSGKLKGPIGESKKMTCKGTVRFSSLIRRIENPASGF